MKPYYKQEIQDKKFLQPEVSRATGVPNKTINNLIERGVFTPAIFDPGRGNRRMFSTEDAARLLVIHELAPLLGGYEEAEKAAIYLSHRLDGRAQINPGDYLIIKPKGAFPPAPIASEHESKKWHMYVLSGPTSSQLETEKILDRVPTIVFPFGILVTLMCDRLWAPYELKRIENPDDPRSWEKARFTDPNATENDQ